MFEAGLAIIAVCLPTINALFRKMNASSILRSVRSLMSLHSLRSDHGSLNSSTHGASVSSENILTSTPLKMVHLSTSEERSPDYGAEACAMHDLEQGSQLASGQIRVQNDVIQSSSSVGRAAKP